MKRAYIYVRVSTEDQKDNWSVKGQEETCRLYCQRKDYEVIDVFRDEGKSAKTFDRPAWAEMRSRIKRDKPDFIVVQKYDRFSRNVAEGLEMMERLETKHNLRVLSVSEDFQINPHSPVFWEFRTRALVHAEYERRLIADRTGAGRFHASKAGRWMGPAPFGYDNARDERNKPILIVNEAEAATVRQMFSDYLSGLTFAEVKARAHANGFTGRHREAVKRLLTNPVYAGLIQTPEYGGEGRALVTGLHRALIPEATFWAAAERIQGRAGRNEYEAGERLPLRGCVLCQSCGHALTGSRSRGKSGRYWYYYRCLACPGQNFRAERAHGELEEILDGLSFHESTVGRMIAEAERRLLQRIRERQATARKVEREMEEVGKRMEALEAKYLDGRVDDDFFRRWSAKYRREMSSKQSQVDAAGDDGAEAVRRFSECLPLLSSLRHVWNICNARKKAQFLRLIFGEELEKLQTGYRTPWIHPTFAANLKQMSLLTIKENGTPASKSAESSICSPYGTPIEPLRALVEFFADLKRA